MTEDEVSLTIKEAFVNLSNLLDIVDSAWFAEKVYTRMADSVLHFIIITMSNDPLCITAILLNALKKHLDSAKKNVPKLFI